MNYRDFYKNKKRPVSEEVEENPLQGLDLDDPSVDDGLPKREDGSLDTIHDGRPIHLSKIIQIGAAFGKGASGAVSGMSNVGVGEKSKGACQSKDGEGVHVEKDQEPLTAGGEGFSAEIASKSVGGEVTDGGGQRQAGPNHGGAIAETPRSGEGETEGDSVLSLQEAKDKLRNMVKEALKEISFNKQTGRWERLTENHDDAGFPTDGTGRPQYKIGGPQYRTADDVYARTRQYEPEITEMYDEEEECMMQERYTELANASRNLSESELSELRDLGGKLEERNWMKNIKHNGACTPMDKATCTPRRKAFARRAKAGEFSENNVGEVYAHGSEKCPKCGKDMYAGFNDKNGKRTTIVQCSSCGYTEKKSKKVNEAQVNMKMGPSYKVVQPTLAKTSEPDFFARTNQYDPEVSENTVDMKMGPAYKKVQPRLAKTAADDFPRTNQFDPEVSEYGAPVIEPEVEPDVEPWRHPETEPEPTYPQEPEPHVPDPLQPDRPGIEPRPRGEGVTEAGGGAVQHSSYRTANDYPYGKNRHANDIDESAKKKVNEVANKWKILHDIATHCEKRFPTITSNQLRKVIPILFKQDTGWNVNSKQLDEVVAKIKSGKIKQ